MPHGAAPQVGFPLIVSESGSGGLDNCLSFYKSGDYTDLEWMAEAIVHGHAMNWAQVCAPPLCLPDLQGRLIAGLRQPPPPS